MDRQTYDRLRQRILQTDDELTVAEASTTIKSYVVNRDIVAAWRNCMNQCFDRRGLHYKITGSLESQFILAIKYDPIVTTDPPSITVADAVYTDGVKPVGEHRLHKGAVVERNTPFLQVFQRVNAEISASIEVSFVGQQGITVPIPVKPKKTTTTPPEGGGPPIIPTKRVIVNPPPTPRYVPPRVRGNADFDSHPDNPTHFTIKADLEQSEDNHRLFVRLYMHGEES